MKILIDVPEGISEEEVKILLRKYAKRKERYREYYRLIEEVDWDELEREVKEFRRSFRLREFDD